MKDQSDLLKRIYEIHYRLRLRNPASEEDKTEWASIRADLRKLFEKAEQESWIKKIFRL